MVLSMMKMSSPIRAIRALIISAAVLSSSAALSGVSASYSNASATVFIFGDSLVDAGNNNYLPFSIATAKNPPNGIDFPEPNGNQATGRFTNGLTLPDIIAKKRGEPMVPPSLAPHAHGEALLHGVNYASGGGGILNNTGRIFVDRISMDMQVSYFDETIAELRVVMESPARVADLLSRAIYMIVVGANDFLDNYLFPVPLTLDKFLASPIYIHKVVARYKAQLTHIYRNGARKFVIVNMPALGCAPYLRSLHVGTGGACSERANRLAAVFNARLRLMLQGLGANLPNSTFVYADSYSLFLHILDNYRLYGFENIDTACCGKFGSKRGIIPCRFFAKDCTNRSKFFFWDPYHPTQGVYEIFANEFYEGNHYISPMNIRDLIAL